MSRVHWRGTKTANSKVLNFATHNFQIPYIFKKIHSHEATLHCCISVFVIPLMVSNLYLYNWPPTLLLLHVVVREKINFVSNSWWKNFLDENAVKTKWSSYVEWGGVRNMVVRDDINMLRGTLHLCSGNWELKSLYCPIPSTSCLLVSS